MRIATMVRLNPTQLTVGLLVALVIGAIASQEAEAATLIGDTVTWRLENCCGGTFFTASGTVDGSGIPEFFRDQGLFRVTSDIGASVFKLSVTGAGFDSLTIAVNWEDLDWVDAPDDIITGAMSEITASSGVMSGGDAQPSLTDHGVRLQVDMNVERAGFSRSWQIDLAAAHATVPSLGTLGLLAVGLAGIGAWRSRQKEH